MRQIACEHIKGDVSTADIERDVERVFKIDIKGQLAELQEPMVESRVCAQPITCFLLALNFPQIATSLHLLPTEYLFSPLGAQGDLRQGRGCIEGSAWLQ